MNSIEILDKKNQLVKRNLDILATVKKEQRDLTEDENAEFEANEQELKDLSEQEELLEKELENTETEKEDDKNIDKDNMEKKSFSFVKSIKRAMETGKPVLELRADGINYSVAANGEDVVETDVLSILEPLRANLVFSKVGAHYLGNLVGDVQVPIMSATNVHWAGEIEPANDGSGSLTNITLSPKRLTAKVPISLQMLAQTSQDIEGIIYNDLIRAIADKIEATVLGYAAGSTTQPAGMFNGATLVDITNYGDLCDFEAEVEEANVYGDMHYVITPKAKAYLRGLIKGTNNTSMVYEAGEIDGIPTEVTTNLAVAEDDKLGVLYGNFDNLYIGTWGDMRIDLVQDSTTLSQGQVMLIVNFFCDAKVARDEAFALGHIVEAEEGE